jgi:hypothetical protein
VARRGLVQRAVAQRGLVHRALARRGLVRCGAVWQVYYAKNSAFSAPWRGAAVRCGAVPRGAVPWRGAVLLGVVRFSARCSSPEFEPKLPGLDQGNEYLDRSPHSEGSKKRRGGAGAGFVGTFANLFWSSWFFSSS